MGDGHGKSNEIIRKMCNFTSLLWKHWETQSMLHVHKGRGEFGLPRLKHPCFSNFGCWTTAAGGSMTVSLKI